MKMLGGIAAVVLVFAGAPKPPLTVSVSGDGSVSSRPAGISCPKRCTLHVKKGSKVTLTASPNSGAEFSHWSKPCGATFTCTVKMAAARKVRAYFKAEPSPPPPPPPPPPAAKAGNYTGTYSDGSVFDFTVQGTTLTNLKFDFNGHCSDGSNLASDPLDINGTFPIGSDGSVSGHVTLTYSNASGTADFAGKLTSSGSGSGTLSVDVTFNGGPGCTSTGTWTSQQTS